MAFSFEERDKAVAKLEDRWDPSKVKLENQWLGRVRAWDWPYVTAKCGEEGSYDLGTAADLMRGSICARYTAFDEEDKSAFEQALRTVAEEQGFEVREDRWTDVRNPLFIVLPVEVED
jgi:hypothetical protein